MHEQKKMLLINEYKEIKTCVNLKAGFNYKPENQQPKEHCLQTLKLSKINK